MIDLSEHINFHGPEWQAQKAWLLETKERKVGLLITAADHDTSNKIRGSLEFINQLLALENAALAAALQRK